MRKIHVIGLALAAVFAYSAFSVASAMALESVWLVDGVKAAAAEPVDSSGSLTLEDTKAGPFGEDVALTCEGTDAGSVGPGAADLTTAITVTKCKANKLCQESPEPKASALKLPWITKIELIGGVFYDDIVAETGEVEYLTTCTVIGVTIEDTCKLALGRALLENSGSNVNAVFNPADANQPNGNCSRGGNGTGLVTGTDVNLSTAGLTIAVSEG
jgi:hypothetical protein